MLNKQFIKIFSYFILSILLFFLVVNVGNYVRITNSEAYVLAKAYIKTHPDLIEKVGDIQSFGRFPSGKIGYENGKNIAQIETNIVGMKKSGKVIVLMEKRPNKEWVYKKIYFDENR